MFMLPQFALFGRKAEPTPFPLHFSLLQKSLYSGELQLPTFLLGLKKYFCLSEEKHSIWLTCPDLLLLNVPGTLTLVHCFSGSRPSSDIFFASSSLALFCWREVLKIWALITSHSSYSTLPSQSTAPFLQFSENSLR